MNIQKITESPWFTKALISVGLLLAALIVFQAGVYVGARKASVSFRMGDNYYRAVGPGGFRGFFGEEFSETNGAAGKIVSVSLPTFVVSGPGGERVILISGNTVIRKMRDATSSTAIVPGESAIVIGEPDENGQIEAGLIRLLPPPPGMPGTVNISR